jgi:hypothetical protein
MGPMVPPTREAEEPPMDILGRRLVDGLMPQRPTLRSQPMSFNEHSHVENANVGASFAVSVPEYALCSRASD